MTIKVFYNPKQSVESNSSFSPSAGKPALVVESWKRLPIPVDTILSSRASRDDLSQAHDRQYVDAVLNGHAANGFGNRSLAVARSLPWVTGSMIDAVKYSIETGEPTFSPTSGAHHAGYDHGGGFCTFNFLVIAAIKAHQITGKDVAILDVDCHYGNGTDDIKSKLKLDWLMHYTFGSQSISKGVSAQKWIESLASTIESFGEIGLLIYNAGVDSHIDDPLGGVLTTEELAQRDKGVFEAAKQLGIPVVTSLAGGYQRDADNNPTPVLRLHDNTLLACAKAHGYIVRSPDQEASILKLLEELFDLGQLESVVQAVEQIKARSKMTNGKLWLLYGVCLGGLGHHEKSIDAFLQSLLLSRNQLAGVNYVTALLASDDVVRACAALEAIYLDLDDDLQGVVARSFVEAVRIGAIAEEMVPQSLKDTLSNVVTL